MFIPAMIRRTPVLFLILFQLFVIPIFGQNTLSDKLADIAGNINGTLGVSAMLLETGESASHNGQKKFPMQSVYKFPIAMAMLQQIDQGVYSLDDTVIVNTTEYIPKAGHSPIREKYPQGAALTIRELLRYNVSESDGTACDVLLKLMGGTDKTEEHVHNMGIKDMAISTTEMIQVANDTIQYQNWTTPEAMTGLLRLFHNGDQLSERSKELLTEWMSVSGKWFDGRIKGLLPEGTPVIHKTGSSRTYNGLTRATNDAGIISLPNGQHIAVSVFLSDSHATHEEREHAIAQASRAVYNYWTGALPDKTISITIDDVPNVTPYPDNTAPDRLLQVLDSLDIPFTVFINESRVFNGELTERNKRILESWIDNDQALIGNHTFSHMRYSTADTEDFIRDMEKGKLLSNQYARTHGKEVSYFRFPYNDLGKDSVQHVLMREYLSSNKYVLAPFTIESADWMFNAVYTHYKKSGQDAKAREIGQQYVNKTMQLVKFYENMSQSEYGRSISHIYLCHDNLLNADYLDDILQRLRTEGYRIISFDKSLEDPVYDQENTYYLKWGVSWMYRWMDSPEERTRWMKREPDLAEIENVYEELRTK